MLQLCSLCSPRLKLKETILIISKCKMFIDLRSFIRSFLYKNWERLNRAPRRIQGHLPLIRQHISKTLKLNFFINSVASVKKRYWAWIFLCFLFHFFRFFRQSWGTVASILPPSLPSWLQWALPIPWIWYVETVRSNHLHIYSQPSSSTICI